ncbi:MAG: orotidine 5'-phosphate decarboxylase / HUMPS family protein [Sulfolobales archaeon]
MKKLRSKIILAIDDASFFNKLGDVSELLAGVKLGFPIFLELNILNIKNIILKNNIKNIIIDLKLADIGDIMISSVSKLIDIGDGFIAHSFIGKEESLDKLKKFLDDNNKKLYLILSMSHPGWRDEFFYDHLKRIIAEVDPYGIVVPATKPQIIERARNDFPKKVIISPGVGTQGAPFGIGLCKGSDYEIIGRSITKSIRPREIILKIIEAQERMLNECKKG